MAPYSGSIATCASLSLPGAMGRSLVCRTVCPFTSMGQRVAPERILYATEFKSAGSDGRHVFSRTVMPTKPGLMAYFIPALPTMPSTV